MKKHGYAIPNAGTAWAGIPDCLKLLGMQHLIVQLGSIIWSIWKNHNFTEAALDGQTVINRSKGKIDLTEVNQEVERVSSGVDVDFSEDEEGE